MSWIFFLCLSWAQAGFLKMVSEPHLEIQSQGDQILLTGDFQILNEGDENSLEVSPELKIDNYTWKGKSQDLAANQGARWELREKVPLCTRVGPDCPIALPSRGQFLVRILKNYQDQNSYAFAVPDVVIQSSKESSESWPMTLQMDLKTALSATGEYTIDYTLKNLTGKQMKVNVRPVLPAEMKLQSAISPIEIPSNGEVTSSFTFQNIKGLPGSQYVVFLGAEWVEEGARRSNFAYTMVSVPQKESSLSWSADRIFTIWWIWFSFLTLIFMWIFWIRPLKKLIK
jgi:hypothetical protein